MTWKGCAALVVMFVLGFTAAQAAHSLIEAKKRSSAKRTAADCRTISDAIEAYRKDHGDYPPLDGNIEHLRAYLTPAYLRVLPTYDMSRQPYLVVLNGSRVAVISVGQFGAAAQEGHLIRGAATQ